MFFESVKVADAICETARFARAGGRRTAFGELYRNGAESCDITYQRYYKLATIAFSALGYRLINTTF